MSEYSDIPSGRTIFERTESPARVPTGQQALALDLKTSGVEDMCSDVCPSLTSLSPGQWPLQCSGGARAPHSCCFTWHWPFTGVTTMFYRHDPFLSLRLAQDSGQYSQNKSSYLCWTYWGRLAVFLLYLRLVGCRSGPTKRHLKGAYLE